MSSYQRFVPNAAERDPLNVRIQSSMDGTLDQLEPTFENWSAPQVKEAIAGLQRADAKRNARSQCADAFVALHPEFLDTESNGEAMNRTLQTLYGDVVFTPGHFEQAYRVLRANNALDLDQAIIVQQEQAAADERARALRAAPSEDDLYEMSMEDLRRLGAIDAQKRMQQRGEEGGW